MAKKAQRSFQDKAMKEVSTTLDRLSGRYSRWEIWQDFVMMGAISIANVMDTPYRKDREQAYLDRAKKYRKEELESLASMLAAVVIGMEANPNQDFLGELYMGLGLGNEHAGQFFTPYHICHLMAEMSAGENLEAQVEEQGWISVNDPCCGGGALLLAFANVCREKKINFQTSVLFVAQDIDPTVAMMCYIQLSLMGCPGYVVVGNSILHPSTSIDHRGLIPRDEGNAWYTPMYFSNIWQGRILCTQMDLLMQSAMQAKPAVATAENAHTATETKPQAQPAVELTEGKAGQLMLF